MVSSGLTAATLITDDPALFPVLASPPPLTFTVLVMEAGAFEAILACKVMAELEPAASAIDRVQVYVYVSARFHPAHFSEVFHLFYLLLPTVKLAG